MASHVRQLLRVEGSGAQQDRVWHGEHADIVEYRGDLEEVNGESPGRLPFRSGYVWSVQDTGYGERGANGPELLLVGEDPAGSGKPLPDEVHGEDWQQLVRVEDPEGGRGSTVWARHDADPCDTRPEPDDPIEERPGRTEP